MAQSENISSLEQSRQSLEQTMEQLRRSLQHWQSCEAEYEGLKEEIESLPSGATSQDLLKIGRTFGGEVIDEKEVNDLLGNSTTSQRSKEQIVGLILRRIEYVRRNVEAVTKRLTPLEATPEDELVASKQEEKGQDGLPLTEIYEELDEDGNVVSSHISLPEDETSDIQNTLDEAANLRSGGSALKNDQLNVEGKNSAKKDDRSSISLAEDSSVPRSGSSNGRKKSVAFANGTKETSREEQKGPANPPRSIQSAGPAQSSLSDLAKGSFSDSERVIEVGDDDRPIAVKGPPPSNDDSPEDASLRREMLNYTMNEVGSVVAQIDLENGQSGGSDSESDDLELASEGSSEADDDHGMSTIHGISDQYRQEMLDLEKKLNAQVLRNVGPNLEDETGREDIMEDVGKPPATNGDHDSIQGTPRASTNPKEKGVRFAEYVDIEPTNATKSPQYQETPVSERRPNPAIHDNVVEHDKPSTSQKSFDQTPRKASRFKERRSAQSSSANKNKTLCNQSDQETSNERSPLVDQIIERPV